MVSQIDRAKTGNLIKDAMEDRGITPKDVMEYFNFSNVQSVYHWIEGKSLPTLDNIYGLSDLLGVPVDKLLYGNRSARYRFQQDYCFERLGIYYESILRYTSRTLVL